MAELTLAPSRDRSPLRAVLLAVVVLAAIAVAVFYFVPHDTAKLTVTQVEVFAPRTEFKPGRNESGMNIIGQQSAIEDDLYVVATVHLQNTFHYAVSVDAMSGLLTANNGSQQPGTSVARTDVARLKSIFPALAPMIVNPIGYDDEVSPGKALDGQVVLQFPGIGADAWQARKSATLTLAMHNQPPQTVTLK